VVELDRIVDGLLETHGGNQPGGSHARLSATDPVLAGLRDGFSVRVIDYGLANKRISDRAIRCIEREKLRRYHLRPD
jgi:hypothetical protein